MLAAAAIAVLSALALPMGGANAQTCGTDYVIAEGDSLARIAVRVYGKTSNWTIIFYANQDRLGASSSLLVPGLAIRIPCIGVEKQAEALPAAATSEAKSTAGVASPQVVVSQQIKRIEFLTADDYAPFTGRDLLNGGMSTDIVSTAMTKLEEESGGKFDFAISWVNDWSAHLNPLLTTRAFDMGFPWAKPACENFTDLDTNAKFRCQKFFFSVPVFEELTLFFVRPDSPFTYESDAEFVGKTLCRPAGYTTFELDSDGRNWVKDNKITLARPQGVDDCFRMLLDGEVDAVSINELTGRASLARLGIAKQVRVIEKPLAVISLHVIVAKAHPNSRTLLYYVNSAIEKLKTTGEFDQIVEKHLQEFWDAQAEQERVPAAAVPAASGAEPDPSAATATAKTTTAETAPVAGTAE